MSNEKHSQESEPVSSATPTSVPLEGTNLPEVVVDKVKNEVTIVGPNDQSFTFKTRVIEEEDDDDDYEPMTVEEFQEALEAVDKLGLTWTADLSPFVKAKTPDAEKALVSEEFSNLQDKYPYLPFEIYSATAYKLTGHKGFAEVGGGEEIIKKKADIAERILINQAYRSEFFFKHSIKVPYLRDIDWEVVYKIYERNAEGIAGVPYSLLALTLQDPFFSGKNRPSRNVTVAVDETLVNKLLAILTELKSKLEDAGRISDVLSKQHMLGEQDHDDEKAKQHLE
jgi:hypothetical protein